MMKNKFFFTLLFVCCTTCIFAQVKWQADSDHTNARFSVNHLGISFVDGGFRCVEGQMQSPSATDFDGAVFNYTIQVNSIDTHNNKRDQNLLSSKFFDAEKYPTISLQDAVLHHQKGKHYLLKGKLTLKDVTQPVTFKVVKNGIMTDINGNVHVGFTATTTINRMDFHIDYSHLLPSGIQTIGKEIKIVVNTELIKE